MSYGNRPDITVAVTGDGTMLVAQGTAQDDERIQNAEAVEGGLYYSQLRHRTVAIVGQGASARYLIVTPSQNPNIFAEAYNFRPHGRSLGGGKVVEVGRAPPKPQ